ncbi:MAG: hypothetical protein J5379_09970 [Clostridiales bacterium]|nr:hypothetical protein [Clostridiales bacterium]
MRKIRFQALAMAGVVMMSMFLGGCKDSKKKTAKDKGATKQATAVLDDFCAYYKSGKFEKLEKLIDGKSKGLEKLKDYSESPAKDVFEAARKRISFSIEEVVVDDDEETAEATVVFEYFDVDDLKKKIKKDDTSGDIRKAVTDAKDLDLEFQVDMVFDGEDWYVDSGSMDQIEEEMFSFMEDLNLEVVPVTPTPIPAKEMEVFSSTWYDDKCNEVQGYHESSTYIRFMVILWDSYDNETVTFEFEDYNGSLYSGEYTITNYSDVVDCIWYPTSKLQKGGLTCCVYDSQGRLVAVGCTNVYGDDEDIPAPLYIVSCSMIDKNQNPVPGYHEGDGNIAAKVMLVGDGKTNVYYDFCTVDPQTYLQTVLYSNTVSSDDDGSMAILPWEGMDSIELGTYRLNVYSTTGDLSWSTEFSVVESGKDFPMDEDAAEIYYSCFSLDYWGCDIKGSVPAGTESVYYMFETFSYYTYMKFHFILKDSSGNVVLEGDSILIDDDEARVVIDLSEVEKGTLTMTVLNPDGSVLVEDTLEVT